MVPIKSEANYSDQARRMLNYLQVTKFGMIALQSAFDKLGIKTPENGAKPVGKYQIRRFTQFEVEMLDTEVGGTLIVFTQFILSEDDMPFRVVLDPPIGNLNQLLSIKFNFIIGQSFKELPEMFDANQ